MRQLLVASLIIMAAPVPASSQALIFEDMAPGVTAVLQARDNWVNDSNAVIIRTDHGVVVIDAPADSATVAQTIQTIDAGGSQAVRYLINTHWHGDHTQGNGLYKKRYGDSLTIVGHRSLRREVPERAGAAIEERRVRLTEVIPQAEAQLAEGLSLGGEPLDDEAQARQREGIAAAKEELAGLEGLELVAPDLTFEDRVTLYLGEREIQLLHFRAHTAGDTVVYLPAEKVLVTGDLLDVMPFAGHGYLADWIDTLDRLAKLEVERIVPGHGPVFEGKDQLRLLRDYFNAIVAGAATAHGRGQSLEEAQAAIDLSRFRTALAGDDEVLGRNFDIFAPEAIARAYAEAEDGD